MSDWKMKGKPALVVLHMQQGIVGERANIPGLYEEVKDTGIIPRQQALLSAFRDRKLPVIYVNALHVSNEQNPAGTLPAYGNLYKMIELAKASPNNLEVIPELAPQPGEPVLINWLLGAFTNSGLDQVLKACGAETLVLVGYATHIVIYASAIEAADLWYSVIVPDDACASSSSLKKAHDLVLEIMCPTIALVTSTEDVIAHL